jgi:adenylate cyclase class 2
MKNIEIEIKVKVEDSQPLQAFLEKNAKLVLEEHQIDEYFNAPHRDFVAAKPIKEWLRLRTENGSFSINYKNWHYDKEGESANHCDEYETKIANLDSLKNILNALGFTSLIVVDKLRKSWIYKDYEISMDTVKELGDYVELEYKGHDEKADPNKIAAEMMKFVEELGCGKVTKDKGGYPFALLKLHKK